MIRVFVIDDSLLIQRYVKRLIDNMAGVELVGKAVNPIEAMETLKTIKQPDVLILDLEMPKMDGLTYLQQRKDDIPTIMFSSYVESGSSNALQALRFGACEIIQKNSTTLQFSDEIVKEFERKIIAVSKSKSIKHIIDSPKNIKPTIAKSIAQTTITKPKSSLYNKVIAIGSSTGGVETLETILIQLQPNHSPILITQHMPAGFTASFASRLDKICPNSNIREAQGDETINAGDIFIAPGDKHLEIVSVGINKYKTVLQDYPKVSNHKPSVDVLFTSFANEVNKNTVAFILTGMGQDGVKGITKIHNLGATTYGQDETSSVVYGMPRVAFEAGVIDTQVSLLQIANIINKI